MAYSEELMTILENRNNHISPKLKIKLKEKEKKNELFYIENDNYILIPGNEISKKAQNIAFDDIEQMQLKLINEYENLDNINRIRKSNYLFSFIIKFFFNGDASALKAFSGYRGRTLLTDEELRNVKRDFKIAKEKKKNGEFLTFFMLDIFPGSDRRADAIILTPNYELELYDFSEGQVVAELNSFSGKVEELSESKQKQYMRKERQQKHIDSYSKIVTPSADYLPGIKIQEETEGIKYTFLNGFNVYDFNFAYSAFLKEKRKRIFIPNSICFLMSKDDHAPFIFEFQLKMNIDHPHYVNEKKT